MLVPARTAAKSLGSSSNVFLSLSRYTRTGRWAYRPAATSQVGVTAVSSRQRLRRPGLREMHAEHGRAHALGCAPALGPCMKLAPAFIPTCASLPSRGWNRRGCSRSGPASSCPQGHPPPPPPLARARRRPCPRRDARRAASPGRSLSGVRRGVRWAPTFVQMVRSPIEGARGRQGCRGRGPARSWVAPGTRTRRKTFQDQGLPCSALFAHLQPAPSQPRTGEQHRQDLQHLCSSSSCSAASARVTVPAPCWLPRLQVLPASRAWAWPLHRRPSSFVALSVLSRGRI